MVVRFPPLTSDHFKPDKCPTLKHTRAQSPVKHCKRSTTCSLFGYLSLLTRQRSDACDLGVSELICLLLSRIGDAIAMARPLAGHILLPVTMDVAWCLGDMSGRRRQCHVPSTNCRVTARNGANVLSWL